MVARITSLVFHTFLAAISSQGENFGLPPSIEKGPERLVIYRSGENLTLECIAVSTPEPQYTWTRNGAILDYESRRNIIRPDPSKGSLVIHPATVLDEGYYQCSAENKYGKALSDVAFLQKAVVSPYSANLPNRLYSGAEGTSLKVQCEKTKCVPKPTYSWVIAKTTVDENPVPLEINERVQMDDDGNLYFVHLELNDHQEGKLYKCIVFNPYLDVYTGGSYSTINISSVPDSTKDRSPAILYTTPTPVVGLLGRDITLMCLFSGFPTPHIQWKRRDGQGFPPGRHDYPERENRGYSRLQITNLHQEDEAEYVCEATNGVGEGASATISLNIEASPSYVNFGEEAGFITNLNATDGNTVKLNCHASGEPAVSIEWFINGKPISKHLPSRVHLENDDQTLIVENVCKQCPGSSRRTDLMVIQCNASNVHGYVYSSGYLNVLSPTTITEGPNSTELEYYEDVVFTCKAEADDSTPVQYTWLWEGSSVVYQEGRIQQDENGSLRLITRGEDDGGIHFKGEYTCNATNGYSFALATAYLVLPDTPLHTGHDQPTTALTRPVDPDPVVRVASITDKWWVFAAAAAGLFLLILILTCCLCCFCNNGDTYKVDLLEKKTGNEPEKEIIDSGFQDYQRPEAKLLTCSQASLGSTSMLDSADEGTLPRYGTLTLSKRSSTQL